MMASVNNAPKLSKKRKLGKNKKKSWRASKVDDIEEFLNDERRQILTGGLVSEKTDDSLFIVDKGTVTGTDSKTEPPTKRRRKDKPLKCLAHLEPDPHSKPVRKPDPKNFQAGKRTERIRQRLLERTRSKTRLEAQQQKQQAISEREKKREKKQHLPIVDTNLWADEEQTDINENKVKPPKRKRTKPSALPATLIPHPGASVNPAYDDHQDLLRQALVVEEQKIKKEKKIHNALDAKFPSKSEAPTALTYLQEMSAGLVDDSEEETDEEEEEEEEASLSVNPPVRREDRKTKKQKRVEEELGEQAKQKSKEAEVKRRENMILRIPTLKAEINAEERKRKKKLAEKEKLKAAEKFKTKRLGQVKFEEPDLDLKLSSELVASYRDVKPEGHLLNDIYKSIQRRNIMEPRVRQKKTRKYKPKKFEKKSHKEVIL